MKNNDSYKKRYSRNIFLPEVGKEGQDMLLDAKVLVVGAGGLGSPLLLYLAAAGVGTIGIIDGDKVDLSNLQRQIIYNEGDIGRSKAEIAASKIKALNPDINVVVYKERLTEKNTDIIAGYNIVADGSDNFTTRFLLNESCYKLAKTLVSASVIGFSGQLSTFKAHLGSPHPCYRCFCPQIPPENGLPTCSTAGVLGSVAGVMGSLQATEVIKEILQAGDGLSGKILIYNALKQDFRKITLKRNKGCKVCG